MGKPKIKQSSRADDKAMKEAFIAKHGVKKCPPAGNALPMVEIKHHTSPPLPKAAETPPKEKPELIQRDLGAKPVLMWVPTTELYINNLYQRSVSTGGGKKIIKHIVKEFQWHFFQPVTITQREQSGYWVIDGQHRMKAAQQIGIREIPAVLLDNITPAQQALAFAGINGKRVAVNSYSIHYALVTAADPFSLRLSAVCEKAGVSIPRTKLAYGTKPNETMAVGALRSAMKIYGDDAVIWALRLIVGTYPDEPGVITAGTIRLLSAFYSTYADFPIDDDTMQEMLLDKDLDNLRDESPAGSPRLPWMVHNLATSYNKVLPAGRAKLPDAKDNKEPPGITDSPIGE